MLTSPLINYSIEYMNTVDVYEQLARLTKAIASPRRLELIDLLSQRECPVEDLAELSGISVANTSRHLQALKAARLVAVRREGLYAHYRLADPAVFHLWQAVRDLGERRLATLRELVAIQFAERRSEPALRIPELVRGLEQGTVVVIDARPEREFMAGHIAGAVSLPVEELEARLHVLPSDQEVVAYSRGPYCPYADQAVAALRANGFRARRLAVGFPDWRAAGLPIEGATTP
jgi:rhodanese-related sulfurtransferase/DNA-binding transcriptional ArsR family regulator